MLFDPHTFERLVQAFHRLDHRDVAQAWHQAGTLHMQRKTHMLPQSCSLSQGGLTDEELSRSCRAVIPAVGTSRSHAYRWGTKDVPTSPLLSECR